MARTVLDTPWGPLTLLGGAPASIGEMHATRGVAVQTSAGRAETAFFVDVRHGEVPEHLRVVMFGGYSVPGIGSEKASRTGESTLKVGGALFGWRVQAYLDPATGDVADGRMVEVGLVDSANRYVRSFPPAEEAARKAVTAALGEALARDAGFVARIYVALMQGVASDLDDAVGDAEAALAEARRLRDRAAGLVERAMEVAAGVVP